MIQVIHLINGETIIGDVEGDVSEFYNIYDPFLMEKVDDDIMGKGLKMNYLLTFSEQNYVIIKNSSVLYSYTPSKNMTDYYKKLVEYKEEYNPEEMIEKTIEDMEDMDRHYRELISRRFRGDDDLN